MDSVILFDLYSGAFIFLVALIWCVIRIFQKKSVIYLVGMNEWRQEKRRKVDKISKIVMLSILIWLNCYATWPALKDLPYVVNKEYLTIEGYTDSIDNTKRNTIKTRVFNVKNEDERVKVNARAKFVTKGIWVKVNYLPNTHYGTIVEWRE